MTGAQKQIGQVRKHSVFPLDFEIEEGGREEQSHVKLPGPAAVSAPHLTC